MSSKNKKAVFLWACSFILFFATIFPWIIHRGEISNFDFVIHDKAHFEIKKATYMGEKILRYYYLQDKTPSIPLIFTIGYAFTKWTEERHPDGISAEGFYSDGRILDFYCHVYGNNKAKEKGFYISKDALQKFYDDGGMFSDYELKHIRFSRLYDEDFVLNRKANLDQLTNKFIETYYKIPHEIEDISEFEFK